MADKKLLFLYEATKVVPNNDCGTFIRSQLLSGCHSTTNVNLPAQNFKASVICQGCGVELSQNPPKIYVKSQPKPTKMIKKIKKMIEKKVALSSKLKNIYNSFNNKDYMQLISVCKLCHKRHTTNMKKPKFNLPLPNSEKFKNIQSAKKKKKDMFSGLNKSAVLSVALNKPNNKTNDNNNITGPINTKKSKNIESSNFIPLESSDVSIGSLTVTKNIQSDTRIVAKSSFKSSSNDVSSSNLSNSKQINQNQINNKTNTSNNSNASNVFNNFYKRMVYGNRKEKKRTAKLRKIQDGRIQKNEVLKKTEKNTNKKAEKIKNIANILKQKQSSSNSLASFLKTL